MTCPVILICVAASKGAIDAIGEALGQGPTSTTRQLTDDPDSVGWNSDITGPWPGPVTAYGAYAAAVEKPLADTWLDLANGILPSALAGGRQWGVDGVISEADALAAVTPVGKLKAWIGSNGVDAPASFWGLVAGAGLYQYPPGPT